MESLSPYVGGMFDGSSAQEGVEDSLRRTKSLDEVVRGQLHPATGDAELLHFQRLFAVNIGTAGLGQLFEDACTSLGRAWTRGDCETEDFVDWLRMNLGIDIERQASWRSIRELRLAADVMKHGEGPSADELRKVNPSLFSYPGIEGPEVCITEADFSRYAAALIALWNWLGRELRGKRWQVLHGR